jgi:hypothetical protein
MTRKLALIGIAVIALAGTACAGSSLPAQAKSDLNFNREYLTTYYNNAQHTTVVGYHEVGYGEYCIDYNWGTTSNYSTYTSFPCE